MAQVRVLVSGDQFSAEVDHLRRTQNGLVLALENLAGATFTTLADFQEALANTLSQGVDEDFTTATSGDSYTGSQAEVYGLRIRAQHPRRVGSNGKVATMNLADAND